VDFIGPFVIEGWVLETHLMAELQVLDIELIGKLHCSIDQGMTKFIMDRAGSLED
jgi:hypothetical protein